MFKLAVEMSMTMNVVAAGADLDDVNLQRLRGKCVNDVKRSIGTVKARQDTGYGIIVEKCNALYSIQ